tara:strand:- start:6 stop:236 length:231 start_codon:yes stop_codon:yes gene_type:complete
MNDLPTLRGTLWRIALLLSLTHRASFSADEKGDDSFVPLFNGKNFAGWEIMGQQEGGNRLRDLIHLVVQSELFLNK